MKTQPILEDKLLWEIWFSRFHLSALTVANKLGVFKLLAEQPRDLNALSECIQVNAKGLSALVDLLVALQLLVREGRQLKLTEISQLYLDPVSEFYWGNILAKQEKRDEHRSLIKSLDINKEVFLSYNRKSYAKMWEEGDISRDAAFDFMKSMDNIIQSASHNIIYSGIFDSEESIIDMGGGPGTFASIYLDKYTNRSMAIFELPNVCDILKKGFKNHRLDIIEGNFFKDRYPANYDNFYFSNIFHDWSIEKCYTLAQKTFEALPQNGKIYLLEMLFNNDHSGPLITACFNLFMYLTFSSQQFSQKELFKILTDVGFKRPHVVGDFGYYSLVCAYKN